MCQNTSYALHWAICPTLEPLTNLIQEALKNILTPNKLDISQSTAKNLYIQIMNLDCLQAHYYSHKPSLFSTLSGLVPLELINTLNEYTQSTKTACFLTVQLLLYINQQIYTKIWIPYCTSRSQNSTFNPQLPQYHTTIPHILQPINTLNNNDSITKATINKIETWLPKWINYLTHYSDILTYSQI